MTEETQETTAEPVSEAESRPERPQNALKVMKQRPDWPSIHEELLMGYSPIQEICKNYDIRTSRGTFAIVALQLYRRKIKEKYKAAFGGVAELEKEALRNEYLQKVRHTYDQGSRGNEMALTQKQIVTKGRGKAAQTLVVDTPDHVAAREYQGMMLQAAGKVGEMVGIGPGAQVQINAPQDNRSWQILSLPKQPGVQNRAPLRIVEAQKETA